MAGDARPQYTREKAPSKTIVPSHRPDWIPMERGLVFNIQKYSIHDGPGIRTTVFLKGCPLRCCWCHNPESQSADSELRLQHHRCIRCGGCVEVCPQSSAVGPAALEASDENCMGCGQCAEACPTGARQMAGRAMTVDDVCAEIRRDRVFYDESGGGVTVSGGEPLMQPAFLRSILQVCKSDEIHTAVDTCGWAAREDLLHIAPSTDLFLFDIKFMDDSLHRQYTGRSNAPILDNLKALAAVNANIWIRFPVLPGWNDGREQVEAAARFAASIAGVQQVNLLPYHELGSHKTSSRNAPQGARTLEPPTPERMQRVARTFQSFGLVTQIGG